MVQDAPSNMNNRLGEWSRGHFIANKDDKVRGFFQGVGGLSGLVIGLGIAGQAKEMNWIGVLILAFLGIAIGSAVGKWIWWVLALIAALIIIFSPTIVRELIRNS